MTAPGLRDRSSAKLIAGLLVCVTIVTGWSYVERTRLAGQLTEAQERQDEMSAAVTALAGQVHGMGGDPVAGIEDYGDGPVVVEGERGERGLPGRPGRDGRDGADGSPGADGADGSSGADGVTIIGPIGPAGRDGETVTGPPGPAGPAGDPGPAGSEGSGGPIGPAGPPGAPGGDGADGEPPESWTFSWRGQTWRCTDDSGDLHYECSPVAGDDVTD